VKGLTFNLLDHMAKQAGCCDEAWELVMEFAAAEAALDQSNELKGQPPQQDVARLDVFDLPAEAMLNCLVREQHRTGDEDWDDLDAIPLHAGQPSASDPIHELFVKPFPDEGGGFSSGAFAEQIDFLDQAQERWEGVEDEQRDAEWERYPRLSDAPKPEKR